MPLTYSIITPGEESVSYLNLTSLLSLLADNTSEQISPKDVRDSVFSNWEHGGVLKWNTGTTDYIGVTKNDIKDFKIFLGKKQLSGSDILSSPLLSLSSDTDIFLYNTKSDSNPSQNLKISFLAGASSSLYLYAPFIEVVQVASPSSLNFNLTHNQASGGDFNFVAGLNGNITLNSLTFPTQNEFSSQVGSPDFSNWPDFVLSPDNSGILSLKRVTFSGEFDPIKENIRLGLTTSVSSNTAGLSRNVIIGFGGGPGLTFSPLETDVNFKARRNTIVGARRLGSTLTTGSNNTLIGDSAGNFLTSGYRNTFVGVASGFLNDNGAENVYIGNSAGVEGTASIGNTFVGLGSGFYATGSNNTFVGRYAGVDLRGGDSNVFIGTEAGAPLSGPAINLNNSIAIGRESSPQKDGDIALGSVNYPVNISGTASGITQGYLEILINGVPYKIKLEN